MRNTLLKERLVLPEENQGNEKRKSQVKIEDVEIDLEPYEESNDDEEDEEEIEAVVNEYDEKHKNDFEPDNEDHDIIYHSDYNDYGDYSDYSD